MISILPGIKDTYLYNYLLSSIYVIYLYYQFYHVLLLDELARWYRDDSIMCVTCKPSFLQQSNTNILLRCN